MLSLALSPTSISASGGGRSPLDQLAFLEWTRGYGVITSGSWNQNYLWSDAETWLDTAPFVLATGTWNRRGIWANAATWNDGV